MLRDTNDVSLISAYKSRNEELRSTLPAMYQISLLTFTSYQINIDQINKQFGLLSKLDMHETEKHCTAIKSKISKMFLDGPQIIMDVKTDHVLSSIFCKNESAFWTCGEDKDIKLHNLKGELLSSFQSKSGNVPWDLTVTKEGDLIYSDRKDSSINIVKSEGIVELIKLQGWIPRGVYSTPSGDLLVTMNSEDNEQTKVVRYSGYTEKQNIQWDDEGRPLYTSSGLFNTKYVNENKNLDICVADNNAGAVVVVSAAGILRFRYKGPSFPTKGSFTPVGIATDSQSRILTSDINNDCIHILDRDGQFLRFIVNRKLSRPWGLCVDLKDNLFVAVNEGRVKKIKYYQ
uniref:E3 ubiquitin-protein ligase TRIM71-like n=1 Tax=Crassostrea virginica TaxID=6565 RepID=A0A8B8BP25_CRAVI|nr:E3 ubiquitin-protein ligase TRIM71-like [Crassostrea virginica]